ncbi:MAG: DUF1622 domain-containing protein [Chitinivibrionales bacterium]|nr:DUF1622 domain-containing protein [Chitinivibrionales bacterium]
MRHYLEILEYAIGGIGIAVIVWGVIISIIQLAVLETKRTRGINICKPRELIRLHLGSYLLLGLEILVAADIIRTVITPSIEELIVLGSIVAIRTVLNYFLNKELGAHNCGD